MRYEEEGPDSPFRFVAYYPTTVTIAGIIWIVVGGLIVASMLMLLIVMVGRAATANKVARANHVTPEAEFDVCSGFCSGGVALFGAAFIFVGIQTVRGTARDTLGNGIGSILLGVLSSFFSLAVLAALAESALGSHHVGIQQVIQASVACVGSVGLVAAGILALAGRGSYLAWREAHATGSRRYTPRNQER